MRIDEPIDPNLEMAEIQRRVFRAGGPALLFTRPKDCRFPMLGNLFGTMKRVRYLFRDTLDGVERLVKLQVDPADLLRRPTTYSRPRWTAWHTLPKRVQRGPGAGLRNDASTSCRNCKSWPDDGGAYVTLPQVYTEDPDNPGLLRIEPGHVSRATQRQPIRAEPRGGPALPDPSRHRRASRRGLGAEAAAAGERVRRRAAGHDRGRRDAAARGHQRAGLRRRPGRPPRAHDPPAGQLPIHAEADFCISGYIDPGRQLPEGPFGDHLGYYSLAHDFP